MLVDPKKVVFETKDDIIDYVSAGFLPPRESHFNQVMDKLRNPQDASDPTLNCKKGREVVIDNTVVPEGDRQVLADALARVYGNRVERRDTILTVAGAVVVGTLLYGFFGLRKESSNSSNYLESSVWDLPTGEYVDKNGTKLTVF